MKKYILCDVEPGINMNSEELARVIVQRLGLTPRKKGSTDKLHKVLLQLYEKAKEANRTKDITKSVMTVEEMAYFAGITRQTMYEYLSRWLDLNLITKMSYVNRDNKVVIGYRLNGYTLESAFEKAKSVILNHLSQTEKLIKELQRIRKNEKIKETIDKKKDIKTKHENLEPLSIANQEFDHELTQEEENFRAETSNHYQESNAHKEKQKEDNGIMPNNNQE